MTLQHEIRDDALRLEIAIALLPLVGRVEDLQDERSVGMRGNRLTDHQSRRLVIDDVTRRWASLVPDERRRYGADLTSALMWFTAEYVEVVESAGPDGEYVDAYGYASAMEALWRRHVDQLRASGAP